MVKEKVYKHKEGSNNVILPGDPLGLPDDFKVVVFIDSKVYKFKNLRNINLSPQRYPSGYAGFYLLGRAL